MLGVIIKQELDGYKLSNFANAILIMGFKNKSEPRD